METLYTKPNSSASGWNKLLVACGPQECEERCLGGDDENESYDEFSPVRMNWDDEIPVANFPRSTSSKSGPTKLGFGKAPSTATFSLPWADLNGNQRPNTLLSRRSESKSSSGYHTEQPKDESRVSREQGIVDGAFSAVEHDQYWSSEIKTDSLLPFASNFASPNPPKFANLPMPKFVTGIPVKAYQYQHDASDPTDVALYNQLQKLDDEASLLLALHRVEPGRYEIDGRLVRVYMGRKGEHQFMVHEDEIGGPSIADMPLSTYIRLVANVAVQLQRPGFSPTLTFFEKGKRLHANIQGEDRYQAMRTACTQAHLRQQEVECRSASH